MTGERCLLLPVEVKARELNGKIALALAAVSRGWTVYLGWSAVVQSLAKYVRPGIYLEKNLHPARARLFADLRARGHTLLALEEEGLAVLNYDWYVTKNIQRHMLEKVDRFLSWGEMEAEAIRRHHPALADRVVLTGNPRADLLRPEYTEVIRQEAAGYQKRFGRYIVLVSSFSRVNLSAGSLDDFARNVVGRLSLGPTEAAFLRDSLDHTDKIFQAFKDMIPRLAAAFPDLPIILRPHPSENQKTWHKLAVGLPNVHVIADGTAIGWIAGAAVMVHNGCTTAIEAALLGGLPIAYQPVRSDRFDVPLPNDLSEVAGSVDEVIALLAHRLDHQSVEITPTRQALLKRAVVSVDGATACDRIIECAEGIYPAADGHDQLWAFRLENARVNLGRAAQFTCLNAKTFVAWALGRARGMPLRYSAQKFSGITAADLDALISTFPAERVPSLRIVRVAPHCFQLSPWQNAR